MPAENVIELDAQAAEVLRRISDRAKAKGETLAAYLSHVFLDEVEQNERAISQQQAWHSFVTGMTSWSKDHLRPGYTADDSRDSAYDERT